MKPLRIRVGIAATSLALAGTFLAASASAGEVSVGDFYREIAKHRNVAATDEATAEKALRAGGLSLPALDLRRVLTEGDVVRISEAIGIRVRTSRPQAPVTRRQLDAFSRTFADDLSGANGQGDRNQGQHGPPREDPQPDKGKSKGFYKSVSEPI